MIPTCSSLAHSQRRSSTDGLNLLTDASLLPLSALLMLPRRREAFLCRSSDVPLSCFFSCVAQVCPGTFQARPFARPAVSLYVAHCSPPVRMRYIPPPRHLPLPTRSRERRGEYSSIWPLHARRASPRTLARAQDSLGRTPYSTVFLGCPSSPLISSPYTMYTASGTSISLQTYKVDTVHELGRQRPTRTSGMRASERDCSDIGVRAVADTDAARRCRMMRHARSAWNARCGLPDNLRHFVWSDGKGRWRTRRGGP